MSKANIRILKQCLNCGNMFEAHKTTTKYCSHKCNSQHYKLRRRLELKNLIEIDTKKKVHNYYIPQHILEETKSDYDCNNFIQNLLYNITYPFDNDEVNQLIDLYQLGTITDRYMRGAITFPFIDINQKVNALQCKSFDLMNKTKHTNFLHSALLNLLNKKG